MKLHIFRLSGHDFVHYRKIEIGANDRAVYQQSISCFIVYANFDWFLINLFNSVISYGWNNYIIFHIASISFYRSVGCLVSIFLIQYPTQGDCPL